MSSSSTTTSRIVVTPNRLLTCGNAGQGPFSLARNGPNSAGIPHEIDQRGVRLRPCASERGTWSGIGTPATSPSSRSWTATSCCSPRCPRASCSGEYDLHPGRLEVAPRRRWATVASRAPDTPLPDPHGASAMAEVDGLRVYSSIVPWRNFGTRYPRGTVLPLSRRPSPPSLR
jgi:hypothetical protein